MAIEEQVTSQEFRPPPEEEGPPERRLTPLEWVRENLFPTWYDSVITLILAPIIAWIVYRSLRFVFFTGRWEIVEVNLTNFMVGRFPRTELWRLWVAAFVLCLVVGVALGAMSRATQLAAEAKGVAVDQSWHELLRRGTPLALLILVFAVFVRTITPLALLGAAIVVTLGAFQLGKRLPQEWRRWVNLAVIVGLVISYQVIVGFGGVLWDRWGGFLLNVFFSVGGIALSFPLGVLLALGRRSSLPAVRLVCVAYIEFFRGIPLIALLFMSWLLLGFFLPPDFFTPDRVLRAMVAFILFTAAYVAEIVRGGLQSIPNGQYEAAVAVGLPPWKVTRLVVLPQALRNVIPALVGQFISLFKDTTLVFVIALLDLLRVARNVTQQPGFLGQGLHAEALAFITFIFWVGCYWMSRESQRLEKRLGVGER
jgi:general L-amino acid transport system permease protein